MSPTPGTYPSGSRPPIAKEVAWGLWEGLTLGLGLALGFGWGSRGGGGGYPATLEVAGLHWLFGGLGGGPPPAGGACAAATARAAAAAAAPLLPYHRPNPALRVLPPPPLFPATHLPKRCSTERAMLGHAAQLRDPHEVLLAHSIAPIHPHPAEVPTLRQQAATCENRKQRQVCSSDVLGSRPSDVVAPF